MSTVPIFSPQCPYLGLIPGGLRQGVTLRIRVTINAYNNRCHINIQSGAALRPRDDTCLHLSIRPQENCIVRNHFKDQIWGQEERHGGFPINWHDSFEISITPEPANFRISINGNHFCIFNHRLPAHLARFVSIDGGCTIQYINVDEPEPSYSGVSGPTNVNVPYPIAPMAPMPIVPAPGYPQYGHHSHYPPPVPPPMPSYVPTPPPPYPGGNYPSAYSATSAEEQKKKDKNNLKVAAGVGAVAGITAVALSSASRNLRKHRK